MKTQTPRIRPDGATLSRRPSARPLQDGEAEVCDLGPVVRVEEHVHGLEIQVENLRGTLKK